MKLKIKETKMVTREATREEMFAIDIVKNNPYNDTFYMMASNFLHELGYVSHSIIYNIEDKTVKHINIQVKDDCIRNATKDDVAMFTFYMMLHQYDNPWDVLVGDIQVTLADICQIQISRYEFDKYMKTHKFIIEE